MGEESDGTVWDWGDNNHGQLGNNRTTKSWVPVRVLLPTGHALYGDFEGDGRSDLPWRREVTGQAVIWLMNSMSISSTDAPATVTADWQIMPP